MKSADLTIADLAVQLRAQSHNVLRGTHDPVYVAGLLSICALELIDADERAAAAADKMAAWDANASAPPPPAEAIRQARAAGVRHQFGADGVCHATHEGATGECGATKGRGGRPPKQPPVPPASGVITGTGLPPNYRAPAPMGDAAADKYADGNGGSSMRQR